MWFQRDFSKYLSKTSPGGFLPIKVLKGPRQVGKTSILEHLGSHELVLFDDLSIRQLAEQNPALFFSQYQNRVILDEATLAPQIFPELKKQVDEQRREARKSDSKLDIDLWITGSNQTLLQKNIRESLAGRASYFTLNTLSMHEIKKFRELKLEDLFMRGGWPELYATPALMPTKYLNDFINTFIEKDIVYAAGISRRDAFSRGLQLCAGRVGQMLNYSDIAANIGVEMTTLKSWVSILEQNGIVRTLSPYFSNLNQRLIKTPKIYLEDVGLAVRLQGWTEYRPLITSPYFGGLLENLALGEITRFFTNRGLEPEIFFLRTKDKVEVDFLIKLPNDRYIVAEVKSKPAGFSDDQNNLLDTLKINIIEKWMLSPVKASVLSNAKPVVFSDIFENLERVF